MDDLINIYFFVSELLLNKSIKFSSSDDYLNSNTIASDVDIYIIGKKDILQ